MPSKGKKYFFQKLTHHLLLLMIYSINVSFPDFMQLKTLFTQLVFLFQ